MTGLIQFVSAARHRHADRADSRECSSQGGFALLATIAIVGATSVLIMAMLGMSLAASKFSSAQVARDDQTRAGDGAIDTAINVLRTEARKVGRYEDTEPCVLASPNGDGLPEITVGDSKAVITCTPQSPDAPPAPLPGEPASEQVRVVGTDYGGTAYPSDASWDAGLAALSGTDRANAKSYAQAGATIVHSGPGPLTFSSDVSVRKGAAAVRNPADDSGRALGPALAVSGLYSQGDSGLSDTNQANTHDCGAQSRWNEPATKPVWFASILLEPKCNVAAARDLRPETSGQEAPVRWPNTSLDSEHSLPSCAGNVIKIQPGVYGPARTATLNQWFKQDGTCDNKTFVFLSGDYFFDVNTPASALVFDDPTSNVIFGNPGRVWDITQAPPASEVAQFFPKACDVNSDGGAVGATGVTITLSTRTTLRHQRGRVAICDQRVSLDPVTAIWQSPTLSTPWGATPPSASPAPAATLVANPGAMLAVLFSNPGNARVTDGALATAVVGCRAFAGQQWLGDLLGLTTCEKVSTARLEVSQWQAALPTVASPIDSLILDVVGTQKYISNASGRLKVRLTGPLIAGGFCEVSSNSTAALTRSLEMLDPATGDCHDKIDDVRDLAGASTTVTWEFAPKCSLLKITILWWTYNFDPTVCKTNDKPYIAVDSLSLRAQSKLDKGPIPGGSSFLVTSNVAPANPSDVASFNVFGQTSVPRADIDIRWNGTPTKDPVSGNVLPIFGGTMVVNGISSVAPTTSVAGAFVARPGIVCCAIAEPSERMVVLNSWGDMKATGTTDALGVAQFRGRLLSSARVAIRDYRVGLSGRPEYAPGSSVRIENWQLCDSPLSAFPGISPTASATTVQCDSVSG